MGASAISLHWRFEMPSPLDNAYFFQRIWRVVSDTPACQTLLLTEADSSLLMGRHLEPILALTLPFVALFPQVETLFVLQGALLALGALPVHRFTTRLTRDPWAGLLLALAWLTLPLLWRVALTDFRTLALCTPFLMACWTLATERKAFSTMIFALLALSCREEVAWFLLASLPALWLSMSARADRGAWGLVLSLGGLALLWLLLTRLVLGHLSDYVPLEALLQGLLGAPLAWISGDPEALAHLKPAGEALEYMRSSADASILPLLLSPAWALVALANLLGVMLSEGLARRPFYHYLAPTLAVAPLAWATLLARLRSQQTRLLAGALLLVNLALMISDPPAGVDSGLRVLCGTLRPERMPGSTWPLIQQIPDDAAVLTGDMFVPHLVARAEIYDADELGEPGHKRAVIERVSWALLLDGSPLIEELERSEFEVVAAEWGETLLRRRTERLASGEPVCL